MKLVFGKGSVKKEPDELRIWLDEENGVIRCRNGITEWELAEFIEYHGRLCLYLPSCIQDELIAVDEHGRIKVSE